MLQRIVASLGCEGALPVKVTDRAIADIRLVPVSAIIAYSYIIDSLNALNQVSRVCKLDSCNNEHSSGSARRLGC